LRFSRHFLLDFIKLNWLVNLASRYIFLLFWVGDDGGSKKFSKKVVIGWFCQTCEQKWRNDDKLIKLFIIIIISLYWLTLGTQDQMGTLRSSCEQKNKTKKKHGATGKETHMGHYRKFVLKRRKIRSHSGLYREKIPRPFFTRRVGRYKLANHVLAKTRFAKKTVHPFCFCIKSVAGWYEIWVVQLHAECLCISSAGNRNCWFYFSF